MLSDTIWKQSKYQLPIFVHAYHAPRTIPGAFRMLSFINQHRTPTPPQNSYAQVTDEETEAQSETSAQSLGKFSEQDSEPGGGSNNILSGWGEGGMGEGRAVRAPSHLAPQQGVGCTFPIPSSNPFGRETDCRGTCKVIYLAHLLS